MKAPSLASLDDKLVDVTAYITDEGTGRDHWRALDVATGLAPVSDHHRRALLVICESERERDYLRKQVEVALSPVEQEAAKGAEIYEVYLTQFRRDLKEVLRRAVNGKPMTAQARATLAEIVDALSGE